MTGNYLTSTFFMLVILAILWLRGKTMIRQPLGRRSCLFLIEMCAAYVFMDGAFIACDLMENCPVNLFKVVVYVFYIVYVMLPYSWHLFVRSFVGQSFSSLSRKLETIPAVVLLALVLITPFTGVLCSVTEEGQYVRGPLFEVYTFLNFFYYVEPLIDAVVICARKEQQKEHYFIQSVIISSIPLLAALVNNLVIPIYQIYPFQPFCSVVVALLAFFFIASRDSEIIQLQHQEAIQEALNQEQEAAKRATEASQVKTAFLSNMSHDIRTPMNAIINLTELARNEDDINVIYDYLGKISISGKFLLGLINDILDMSHIESGKLELHKENLTRTEFINTVETVIYPLMEKKHINFHPELRPGEYTISVDRLRFNQIFFNLLSNAAKFTPDGGDVWFEVNNLEVDGNKLKIQFIVRDNGIGMSEEFLQHIFEPFSREYSAEAEKTQGTGLGLAIVKSLVDAMDGTISVTSEPGKGTEFVVVLYVDIVAKEELPAPAAPHDDNVDLSGLRVLLVEDNELNIYVARTILEKVGCVVTTAENGQIALDTFDASAPFSFDVVLMDVRMPVMDGIECTKAIRALNRPDAADLPIIAMTADAFDNERRSTIEAGMNYHLAKPVDARELYKVLGSCVPRKKIVEG